MSDKCGNCDCADKSQCVKKGNQYGIDIIETENNYVEAMVMDVKTQQLHLSPFPTFNSTKH